MASKSLAAGNGVAVMTSPTESVDSKYSGTLADLLAKEVVCTDSKRLSGDVIKSSNFHSSESTEYAGGSMQSDAPPDLLWEDCESETEADYADADDMPSMGDGHGKASVVSKGNASNASSVCAGRRISVETLVPGISVAKLSRPDSSNASSVCVNTATGRTSFGAGSPYPEFGEVPAEVHSQSGRLFMRLSSETLESGEPRAKSMPEFQQASGMCADLVMQEKEDKPATMKPRMLPSSAPSPNANRVSFEQVRAPQRGSPPTRIAMTTENLANFLQAQEPSIAGTFEDLELVARMKQDAMDSSSKLLKDDLSTTVHINGLSVEPEQRCTKLAFEEERAERMSILSMTSMEICPTMSIGPIFEDDDEEAP